MRTAVLYIYIYIYSEQNIVYIHTYMYAYHAERLYFNSMQPSCHILYICRISVHVFPYLHVIECIYKCILYAGIYMYIYIYI